MNIIKSYPEDMSKKTVYQLTMSPETRKMKDAKGTKLEVSAWCQYRDTDQEGNDRDVLAILTPEGETYASNSPTFADDFFRMVELFGPDGVDAIKVISGTSKAGREFITCAYAG